MMYWDTDDLLKCIKRSRPPTVEQLEELGGEIGMFEEAKDRLSDLIAAAEGTDLSTFDGVLENLEGLFSAKDIEGLEESRTHIEMNLSMILDLPIAEFVEQYDNTLSKLEELVSLREADRYPGKTDDVQSAWEELVSEIESLCETIDQLDPGDLDDDDEPATDG